MGLFKLFKTKRLSHVEKLDMAYGRFKPEIIMVLFPMGKKQADYILTTLARICKIDLDACDEKKYADILTSYTGIYSNIIMTRPSRPYSTETALDIIQRIGHMFVKDRETARKVFGFMAVIGDENNHMAFMQWMVSGSEQAEKEVFSMASKRTLLLKAVHKNMGLKTLGDWERIEWHIFYDGAYEVVSNLINVQKEMKEMTGIMADEAFSKLCRAINYKPWVWNEWADYVCCDGDTWEIVSYGYDGSIKQTFAGYIYENQVLKTIVRLLPGDKKDLYESSYKSEFEEFEKMKEAFRRDAERKTEFEIMLEAYTKKTGDASGDTVVDGADDGHGNQ